jgi:hypothetical protein
MKAALAILLVVAACVTAADRKRRPPDLEIVEVKAQRAQGRVTVDARVRNTSERVIRGLVLVFDFMATGKAVITSQKADIEERELEPGDEAAVQGMLVDPVRAVEYRVGAVDQNGRHLRVSRPGPHPIE